MQKLGENGGIVKHNLGSRPLPLMAVIHNQKMVRQKCLTPQNHLEAATGFEPVNNGFADRRLTTWLRRLWSGKRDLNPRLRPWQGRTLPLSYSRLTTQGPERKKQPLCVLTPFLNKISSRQRPTLPPLRGQYHRRGRA